jgi:hypothetical protein
MHQSRRSIPLALRFGRPNLPWRSDIGKGIALAQQATAEMARAVALKPDDAQNGA